MSPKSVHSSEENELSAARPGNHDILFSNAALVSLVESPAGRGTLEKLGDKKKGKKKNKPFLDSHINPNAPFFVFFFLFLAVSRSVASEVPIRVLPWPARH